MMLSGDIDEAMWELSQFAHLSASGEIRSQLFSMMGRCEEIKGNLHASLEYYKRAWAESAPYSFARYTRECCNLAPAYMAVGDYVFARYWCLRAMRTSLGSCSVPGGSAIKVFFDTLGGRYPSWSEKDICWKVAKHSLKMFGKDGSNLDFDQSVAELFDLEFGRGWRRG